MKTLAELIEAYKSGEITQPVFIGNDYVGVVLHDEYWINVTEVFRRDNTDELLEELLDYLGIPHERALQARSSCAAR